MFFLASSAATLQQLPLPFPRLSPCLPEPDSRPCSGYIQSSFLRADLYFLGKNTHRRKGDLCSDTGDLSEGSTGRVGLPTAPPFCPTATPGHVRGELSTSGLCTVSLQHRGGAGRPWDVFGQDAERGWVCVGLRYPWPRP